MAPDQRLRRSRVLHSSVGESTSSHVAVNFHKMELEEQKRQEVAHEAARESRDEDIDDLKVAVRSEEANERGDAHEPKPRIGAKDKKQA